MGGLLCFGLVGCSDDDEGPGTEGGGGGQPAQQILAVGFDTDRPVKQIQSFYPGEKAPSSTLNFTWQGKNITSMSTAILDNEKETWLEMEKYEYLYRGQEIVCNFYFYDHETNKMVKDENNTNVVLLDKEGYAKSLTGQYLQEQEYGANTETRVIQCWVDQKFEVERDAQHRVTQMVTTETKKYKPEDLKWLKENFGYEPEQSAVYTNEYTYDKEGSPVDGFSEFTNKLVNRNGFFLTSMHAYHFPRSLMPITMGPYDLFNVVKTPYLPDNFEHEIYKYEVDKDGYVTKVYDHRYNDLDSKDVHYMVFKY